MALTPASTSWLVTACAIAGSGINPNGFGVVSTVFAYHRSPMTANLIEWQAPSLWGPPYGFNILLYAAAVVSTSAGTAGKRMFTRTVLSTDTDASRSASTSLRWKRTV